MQFQWPMHLHGHLWKNNVETVAFMINPDQPHQKIDVAKRPTFRDESRFQMSLFCDFFLFSDHIANASLQIRMARSKSIPSDQSLANTTHNSRCLACLSKRKSWLRLSTSRCNLTWFGTWVAVADALTFEHPSSLRNVTSRVRWLHNTCNNLISSWPFFRMFHPRSRCNIESCWQAPQCGGPYHWAGRKAPRINSFLDFA